MRVVILPLLCTVAVFYAFDHECYEMRIVKKYQKVANETELEEYFHRMKIHGVTIKSIDTNTQ